MDPIVKLTIAGAIIGLAYWALQPRYVLLIRIRDGVPRLAKGKVGATFLSEVGDACGREHIDRGWIGGVASGKRVKLAFSRSIPVACQQRLRNLWTMQR